MELLLALLVLLLVSRVFAELAVRIGQPALVGELVAGVSLGLVAHPLVGVWPGLEALPEDPVFRGITDLGVFFLMLLAGLEMSPRDLTEHRGAAIAVALGGMLVPAGLGAWLGWAWLPPSELRPAQVMFLATALAITAVPVSVKVLMDLGRLDTEVGRTIVAAAVLDDILSLVALAALTALVEQGTLPSAAGLGLLLLRVALFFAIALGIGAWLLPRFGRRVAGMMADELELSALVLVGLGFAVLAERLGMHFVIGAFTAGLVFSRQTVNAAVYDDVHRKVSGITTGFLAPLFFASIGLHLDLGALGAVPGFVVLLVGAAFAGKLLGAGIPAWTSGMTALQAAHVGTGMSARGAVELIVADIALRAGLFDRPDPPGIVVGNLFSAVVLMAIATTLVAPIAMKLLPWRDGEPDPSGSVPADPEPIA